MTSSRQGLLRRAGWRVRFLPRLTGSYEETPAHPDRLRPDAIERWCRGNLQHLRLLGHRRPAPRQRASTLFHGAVSLPAVTGLVHAARSSGPCSGKTPTPTLIRYFSEANPLFPDWPPAMSHIDSRRLPGHHVRACLLTPKARWAQRIIATRSPAATRLYGGQAALSSLPSCRRGRPCPSPTRRSSWSNRRRAVLRAALGTSLSWGKQNRHAIVYPLRDLFRFHWVETALGVILTAGLASGLVSLWFIPIAASFLMAVPLSALSAVPVVRCLPGPLRMQSPHTLREPAIVRKAKDKRGRIHAVLDAGQLPAD